MCHMWCPMCIGLVFQIHVRSFKERCTWNERNHSILYSNWWLVRLVSANVFSVSNTFRTHIYTQHPSSSDRRKMMNNKWFLCWVCRLCRCYNAAHLRRQSFHFNICSEKFYLSAHQTVDLLTFFIVNIERHTKDCAMCTWIDVIRASLSVLLQILGHRTVMHNRMIAIFFMGSHNQPLNNEIIFEKNAYIAIFSRRNGQHIVAFGWYVWPRARDIASIDCILYCYCQKQ